MEAKFQIFILLLFYFEFQNTILCMKKLSFNAEKSTKLAEQLDNQALARLIYKDYGTDDKYLCKSFDGKTSRLTAYSICKQAAKKLYPQITIDESDIRCLKVEVPMGYEHAENYIQGIKHSGYSGCPSKRHRMALCREPIIVDGLRNTNHHPFIQFYLIYAKDNFYYVLEKEYRELPSIKAVLKLNPPEPSDYPDVKAEEARDGRIADLIFGLHGISKTTKSYKDEGHVCYKKSKNSAIFGNQVCGIALETLNRRPMFEVKIVCRSHKITRHIKNGCINCQEVTKSSVSMVNCSYACGSTPRTAMVFNGPAKGLFYVGEESGGTVEITHLLDLKEKLKAT